jgi:hypothetical protein
MRLKLRIASAFSESTVTGQKPSAKGVAEKMSKIFEAA